MILIHILIFSLSVETPDHPGLYLVETMFIDTIGILLNFGKTQVYETSVKSPMIVFETMIETMAETNIRIERITNF